MQAFNFVFLFFIFASLYREGELLCHPQFTGKLDKHVVRFPTCDKWSQEVLVMSTCIPRGQDCEIDIQVCNVTTQSGEAR